MRKQIVFLGVGIFYFLFSPPIFAEEIQITSYYPSPYGAYRELETTSNTYLAVNSGNVGIGLKNPRAKLEVLGNIIAADPTEDDHLVTKKYVGGGLYGWCHFVQYFFPPNFGGCDSLPPASCITGGTTPNMPCQCPAGYQLKMIGGHWFAGPFTQSEIWYTCYKE